MSLPILTLSTTPEVFSPVNAPLWFAFTASFAGTGISTNSNLVVNLNVLNQNYEAPGTITGYVLENTGAGYATGSAEIGTGTGYININSLSLGSGLVITVLSTGGGGSIGTYTIAGGSGYRINDTFKLNTGLARGTVTGVSGTTVTAVSWTSLGSGYSPASYLTTTLTGAISTYTYTGGSGYTVGHTYSIAGGVGAYILVTTIDPFILQNVGRFKVPQRANNTFVWNPNDLLKSFITFPFDNGSNPYYVDETTGFTGTGSTPILSPDTESIVRYQIQYGLEYNPNVSFNGLWYQYIGGVTYSAFLLATHSLFGSVGDVINISCDSQLYNYWNGTASILQFNTSGEPWEIITDQVPNITLLTESSGQITGIINDVTHFVGTSSFLYAYNGTRQFYEKDTVFSNQYVLAPPNNYGGGTTFMTDWGFDDNHRFQIAPGQGERVRFLMDFWGDSGYQATNLGWQMVVSDNNYNFINEYTGSFTCSDVFTGMSYSQKCFTVTTFDTLNSIPIIDGYKYDFAIFTIIHVGSSLHKAQYGNAYYVGYDPNTKYNNIRIKFLNRQGSWAYWNFNKDLQQTTTIERTEYKRPLQYNYTLNAANSGYSLSSLRGQAILSSKANETFVLNSDWITEDAFAYLNQLFTSPEVYVYTDTYFDETTFTQVPAQNLPIIITLDSYKYNTLFRDKLFNLTISYKYAFDTNLQNQ